METYVYKQRFGRPVHRTILPSGTNIFTAPTPSQTVTTEVIFPVGALEDGPLMGTAHFFEHMVFKGTGKYDLNPYLVPLDVRGIAYNAVTNYFQTEYYLQGLATDFEMMHHALIHLCREPAFTRQQLEMERRVILQEERQNANSGFVAKWIRMRGHPHLSRFHTSVIGAPEQIALIEPATIRDFIATQYRWEQAAFFAAGGITHEKHIEATIRLLGHGDAQSHTAPATKRCLPLTPFTDTLRHPRVSKSELEWMLPVLPDHHDAHALGLGLEMLQLSNYGILWRNLRQERGLIYGASCSMNGLPIPYIDFRIPVDEQHFSALEELVWECVRELQEMTYPDECFESVMARRRIFFATRNENVKGGKILSWMEASWEQGNYEDTDPVQLVLSTTREEIAAAAKKYLVRDNYALCRLVATQ